MSNRDPGDGPGPGAGRAWPASAPAGPPAPGAGTAEAGGEPGRRAGSGHDPDSGADPNSDPGSGSGSGAAATISELRQQAAAAQDQRLRALADVENVRRRCAAQVSRAEAEARATVAAQWLPVVDNLERALEFSAQDPGAIVEGIRAVLDQALGVLAALDFPRRDDAGVPFDPARHEAVAVRTDPAVPAGTVIGITRPAYGEGDRQLRPAQVVVAGAE
jgi:molecular chaperone GrpE